MIFAKYVKKNGLTKNFHKKLTNSKNPLNDAIPSQA